MDIQQLHVDRLDVQQLTARLHAMMPMISTNSDVEKHFQKDHFHLEPGFVPLVSYFFYLEPEPHVFWFWSGSTFWF